MIDLTAITVKAADEWHKEGLHQAKLAAKASENKNFTEAENHRKSQSLAFESEYRLLKFAAHVINMDKNDIKAISKAFTDAEIPDTLRDWLKFSVDVQPGCAAGQEWLRILQAKTEVLIKSYEEN